MPDQRNHESALRDIAARLRDAQRVVAFTGAGISTESGIPDFRSPGGVWEIGPIISADRWIPDVLCRNLPQIKGPHPLMLGGGGESGRYTQTFSPVIAPRPEPPNPKYEYYVDYCVFFGSSPRPFEAFSDEFNILGYLGRWQVQVQCTLMDTHSYPGHLMLKLLGPGGCFPSRATSASSWGATWRRSTCIAGAPPPAGCMAPGRARRCTRRSWWTTCGIGTG